MGKKTLTEAQLEHIEMRTKKEYGYEKCPLDEDKSCFDYNRYGMLACGLCNANKELAEQGIKNLARVLEGK